MAVAIFDVSLNRVLFANADFRALLWQANLPIETFSTIVSEVSQRSTSIGTMIAQLVCQRARFLSDVGVERIETLSYIPIGDDAGAQCLLVTEENSELIGSLACPTLNRDYLNLALEASGVGAWSLALEDGQAQRTSLHDGIFGYNAPAPEWNLDVFLSHVHADDTERVRRTFDEATASRSEWRFRCKIRRVDGKLRWIEALGRPHGPGNRTITHFIGVVRDITDEVNAVEQRRLLFAELHHRVRNNLAIVDSLISNTLKTTLELHTAADALRRRVSALSKAHDLLIACSSEPINLRTLMIQASTTVSSGPNVELTGEDIDVPLHHVVPLSMWLGELEARSSIDRRLDISRNADAKDEVVLIWSDHVIGEEEWLDALSPKLVCRVLPVQLNGIADHTGCSPYYKVSLKLKDFSKQQKARSEQTLTVTSMVQTPYI